MSRPAWTLTEAVERTGASRSTLRRYRDAGKFPNAYKDRAGAWRFPLEDLLAVGLSPSEPARERAQSKPSEQPLNISSEQASTASAEQVSRLEQALRDERTRADRAEELAASYLANVEDLRRALRMLEAGTSKPEQPTEQAQSKITDHAHPAPTKQAQNHLRTPEQATLDTTKDGPSKPVPVWRRLLSRL